MKFVCVECDAGMKIVETRGPTNGSMSVVFACPKCDWRVGMVTNPFETQIVRALDVKIGGKLVPSGVEGPVPAEPMAATRGSLVAVEAGPVSATAADPAASGAEPKAGGKCPFAGVVNEAFGKQEREASAGGLPWDPAAEDRLQRIPAFVREMAKQGIEMFAREHGQERVTEAVLDEAKIRFGM